MPLVFVCVRFTGHLEDPLTTEDKRCLVQEECESGGTDEGLVGKRGGVSGLDTE